VHDRLHVSTEGEEREDGGRGKRKEGDERRELPLTGGSHVKKENMV
jgi:hypothetical protein